ncbi:MAG: hypothetical protein SGI77_04495 [Pirellulaceae bacterium]|nr:hypothetical protein [Pirellulaceae bacterium]
MCWLLACKLAGKQVNRDRLWLDSNLSRFQDLLPASNPIGLQRITLRYLLTCGLASYAYGQHKCLFAVGRVAS